MLFDGRDRGTSARRPGSPQYGCLPAAAAQYQIDVFYVFILAFLRFGFTVLVLLVGGTNTWLLRLVSILTSWFALAIGSCLHPRWS